MDPYRDVAAEQRIADLERQLHERQDTVEELHRQNKKLRESRLAQLLDPFRWCLLALVTLATIGIWRFTSADGKIDYCYVDTINKRPKNVILFGHRPWRTDAELKRMSVDEDPAPLFALAKELDCPIR